MFVSLSVLVILFRDVLLFQNSVSLLTNAHDVCIFGISPTPMTDIGQSSHRTTIIRGYRRGTESYSELDCLGIFCC